MDLQNVFGSFFISEIEFAISAQKVQEVVVAPGSYIKLPLSPDYLLGMFNLRGNVIPVIDLKNLLKIEDASVREDKRIAIVEVDTFKVGILFTKTGEIFKGSDNERTDFETNYHNGLISGLFKKNNGQRLIQILNLEAVFRLQNISLIKSKIENAHAKMLASRGSKRQTITFKLENINYAIDIKGIQEIIKVDEVPPVLKFHESSLGAINLRGSTIPIIDFGHYLKQKEISTEKSYKETNKRVIVLKINSYKVGLLVDYVDSLLSFYDDQLKTFASVSGKFSNLFEGCITSFSNEEILFIDHLKIFDEKDLNSISGGKSRLGMRAGNSNNEVVKKDPIRSYISFVLQDHFVVRMDAVKEIIELPDNLLSPPNLPKSVKGVLNLRGEVIFILDPNKLLTNESIIKNRKEKIIILKNSNVTFGIIVESVESILRINDSSIMQIPTVIQMQQSLQNNFLSVKDIVKLPDINLSKKEFLLFEVDNFKQLNDLQAA